MEQKKYKYHLDNDSYLLSYVHGVYSYRYHWHDDMYEIHITLTGSLEFVRDGHKYILKPNDVIIVSPGVGHTTLALEPETMALVLRFPSNSFRDLLEKDYICRFNFVSDATSRNTSRYIHIRFYCTQLLRALASNNIYSKRVVKATFDLLIVSLYTMFEEDRADDYQPKNSNIPEGLIQEIIQYIDDNYSKKITLEELSELFKYNRTYISTFFKKNVGVRFYDYLTKTRFSSAVWDLSKADLSLTKIALYNGFPDLKTFNRLFQETFHLPPAKYRENMAQTLMRLPYDYWNFRDLNDHEIKIKLDEYMRL